MKKDEWLELNYDNGFGTRPYESEGVGGHWRGHWQGGYNNYVKRMIGIMWDLPFRHDTDPEGFCSCIVVDLHGYPPPLSFKREPKPERKPYEWL